MCLALLLLFVDTTIIRFGSRRQGRCVPLLVNSYLTLNQKERKKKKKNRNSNFRIQIKANFLPYLLESYARILWEGSTKASQGESQSLSPLFVFHLLPSFFVNFRFVKPSLLELKTLSSSNIRLSLLRIILLSRYVM